MERRRAINQGDQAGVAAAVENFLQSDPPRAELTVLRLRIYNQGRAIGVDDGGQSSFVPAGYYQNLIHQRKKKTYSGGEKCVAGRRRRPRQERLIASHPRGLTRSKNDSAKTEGALHECTIANRCDSAKDAVKSSLKFVSRRLKKFAENSSRISFVPEFRELGLRLFLGGAAVYRCENRPVSTPRL